MPSVARVLQLLDLLQSAPSRTMTEIAERLGVDERTVRRYVRQLAELDVPVESVRGRHGGYRLTAGRHVPPLVLSDDEAVAVVTGLVRAQAASERSDEAAYTALSKIRRVLPAHAAQRVGALLASMAISPEVAADRPDGRTLLTLADAVASRRTVEIRYRDSDDAPSRRTLHPLRLIEHSGRWYLAARDPSLREERTFRVDRIRSVRQTDDDFPEPAARPTVDGLIDRFAHADYPWHVVLRVNAAEAAIRRHLPRSVATVTALGTSPEDDETGWHQVEIRAKSLEWLPSVITAINAEVIVDKPPELHELLEAAAARLLHAARAPDRPTTQ